jgi:hypothetical protein
MGEAVGVATNSKGHIFVYTRTGSTNATTGTSRAFTHGGARLFEFGPEGRFLREVGQDLYGFMFAHVVRVDPQDNIWAVDEGSSMLIKFNPEGRVIMTMGRKPEAVPVPESNAPAPRGGAGIAGDNFNRPTDVAWDGAGNIFVSDGYGNSRIAKFDKNGRLIKSWGSEGRSRASSTRPTRSRSTPRAMYTWGRGNKRIQVFDNDGNFKTQYTHVGARQAVCITPGSHQYLYSSNSNGTASMDNGKSTRWNWTVKSSENSAAGKLLKEFGSVHEIDCRNPNELYVGEITNWRVQARCTLVRSNHFERSETGSGPRPRVSSDSGLIPFHGRCRERRENPRHHLGEG